MIATMISLFIISTAMAQSVDRVSATPMRNSSATYTLTFDTGQSANVSLGADFFLPVGESLRHELFIIPELSFKGSGDVVDVPIASGVPRGSSGKLTLGGVFFRSDEKSKVVFDRYDRAVELCRAIDPKFVDTGNGDELCPQGKPLLQFSKLVPDNASRLVPAVFVNVGVSYSAANFTWRELDDQTTPATLGVEQSVDHPTFKGTLNAAYNPKGSYVIVEGLVHVESDWSASGSTLSWCGTEEYQVGDQIASVEACEESIVGAPTNSRSFGGSVAVGMVDDAFVWRWALQPSFESANGDLTAGLGVPLYVNVTKLNNMSENSSKNILKFTPYVNIPLGVSPVEPRVGVAVSIYNGKQLVDPTLSNL